MSLDADAIADRRRLKRRIALWRMVAVVAVVVAAVWIVLASGTIRVGEHVAEIRLSGILFDDPDRTEELRRLAVDDRAVALILRIDSPGGTVVAGEALYYAVHSVAENKPVVAVIGGTGASAGYLVALAADHIVARRGSVTGSIGVLVQTAEISELLTRLGINAEAIKSSPLKDSLSPLEPISSEARAATQAMVNDMYRWFVDLVAERRELSPAAALQLADGRVFSGRQAVSLSLIDAVGGIEEARTWLEENHGVAREVPVRRIGAPNRLSLSAELFGLARKVLFSETLRLDGLISLWQPEIR